MSSDHAHTEDLDGIHIRIEYDIVEAFQNPRIENDNVTTMVCFHGRYTLGDEHTYESPLAFLNTMIQEYNDDADDFVTLEGAELAFDTLPLVNLPLYLYDHSGITMNTTGFSCPWDSGKVGVIYMTHEQIIKEYGELTDETVNKAADLMRAEVKSYDHYLRGECYITKFYAQKVNNTEEDYDDEEPLETYGGFLGDLSDCIAEAKAEAENMEPV